MFLNRQSAEAHKLLLLAIDDIVFQDTGYHLRFRHLHSESLAKPVGIVSWTIDQHRGQAKGFLHSSPKLYFLQSQV